MNTVGRAERDRDKTLHLHHEEALQIEHIAVDQRDRSLRSSLLAAALALAILAFVP
jgi:hypothetical protein